MLKGDKVGLRARHEDDIPVLRSAERSGFVREGVLRSSAWVMGEFLDEVLLGLLVQDWKPEPKGRAGAACARPLADGRRRAASDGGEGLRSRRQPLNH